MDMNRQKSIAGFTIVELMITVSLLAILASLAAPSFTGTLRQNRLAAQANSFVAALNYARSETIIQNDNISVQPISGTTDWGNGWQVVTVDNAGAILSTLKVFNGIENASFILTPAVAGDTTINFTSNGNLELGGALGNTVLTLTSNTCPTGEQAIRTITINPAGHSNVAQVACP